MAFRFAFKRSRRDSVEGLIGRESFLTPSSLLYPYPASELIVLRRINYHLLSATAEARTKREAPVFWKRNLLVARCATHRPPDAEGHNAPQGLHRDAANNGRRSETSTSRRREARVYRRLISPRFQCSEDVSQKDPERQRLNTERSVFHDVSNLSILKLRI